eukprot:14802154-Alexandrium_andersonii.AAC.1
MPLSELAVDCSRQHIHEHALVTVEDKDPSVLRVQTPLGAYLRWAIQLAGSGDRWKLIWAREADVVQYYRGLYDMLLPKRLKS